MVERLRPAAGAASDTSGSDSDGGRVAGRPMPWAAAAGRRGPTGAVGVAPDSEEDLDSAEALADRSALGKTCFEFCERAQMTGLWAFLPA